MFRDRIEAAQRLAEALKRVELHDPIVLGIPRGGVEVGAELAQTLGADLDVALARKLRAPHQPELALGAVGEDGRIYMDPRNRDAPGVTEAYLQQERRDRYGQLCRRRDMYRKARPKAPIRGRTVILTDDGIATGSTMLAAIETVKGQGAREVIVAVPVGPPDRLEQIRSRVDRLVCLEAPELLQAIGMFYADFSAVEDDRVIELLRRFAPEGEQPPD